MDVHGHDSEEIADLAQSSMTSASHAEAPSNLVADVAIKNNLETSSGKWATDGPPGQCERRRLSGRCGTRRRRRRDEPAARACRRRREGLRPPEDCPPE